MRTLDLLAVDHLATCPGCHELCERGATVCAECGTHLFVRQGSGRPFTRRADGGDPRCADVQGCTCGHAGVCTRCVLFLLDNGLAL